MQGYVNKRIPNILFILNRNDDNSVLRYFAYKTTSIYFSIYNNSFCILYYHFGGCGLKVYDTDSVGDDDVVRVFDGNVPMDTQHVVYSTSNHKNTISEYLVQGSEQKLLSYSVY